MHNLNQIHSGATAHRAAANEAQPRYDAAAVKAALADRMLDVAMHLFPNGKKAGREVHVGDIVGNPGESLKIIIEGDRAGTWCDFAEGTKGGPIDLWMGARNQAFPDALREAAQWLGIAPIGNGATATPKREEKPAPIAMKLPDDATPGTKADWRELAALRHVSIESVCAATHLGTLLFGTVCGSRCWILTDARRFIAEARRMDGKLFPAIGELSERKAHTIKGSVKSWPVGLVPSNYHPDPHAPFVVAEGGPDYLAALHFAFADKPDRLRWHPIAFLGAGTAREIHTEALPLLRGRRVRLYPHADSAGTLAGAKWAAQFAALGATVDAFSFEGLRKATGEPIKDLNDCARIHPEDAAELEGLLP